MVNVTKGLSGPDTLQGLQTRFAQGHQLPDMVPSRLLRDLLFEQANDKNSSTFREGVTADLAGYEQNPDKLGYDVLHHNVEIKPQNYPMDGRKRPRLSGGGNFTDFTWDRHHKYLEDNVTMLVSGFVNGQISYILKFPYELLTKRIEAQLYEQCTVRGNRYCRGASFSFLHYGEESEVVFFAGHRHEPYIQKRLFRHLTGGS
ncbi:MAG: hypothetical protein VW333_05835 [Pseudomonadales bacterium]|jgi:hypothetical protein